MSTTINLYSLTQHNPELYYTKTRKFHVVISNKRGPKHLRSYTFEMIKCILADMSKESDKLRSADHQFRLSIVNRIANHYAKIYMKDLKKRNALIDKIQDESDLKIRRVVDRLFDGHEFMIVPDESMDNTKRVIDLEFGKFGYKVITFE